MPEVLPLTMFLLVGALFISYRLLLPSRPDWAQTINGLLSLIVGLTVTMGLGIEVKQVVDGIAGTIIGSIAGIGLGTVAGAIAVGIIRRGLPPSSFSEAYIPQQPVVIAEQPVLLKEEATVSEAQDKQRPPQFAEYLLYLLLSKKEREHLIGDLEEDYLLVYTKFGQQQARFFYYCQVIRSLGPLFLRAFKRVVTWSVLQWIGNLVGNLFHRLIP